MKRGGPEHPKTKLLAKALGVPIYGAVGILEMLFHATARHARAGNIGKWENEEIAEAVGFDGDPHKLVDALKACGWLDAHPEYRLVVHDWHEHADDATKKQIARDGGGWASGSSNPVRVRPKVYFVQEQGTGRIKIGFTEGDIESRIAALQTGSAHPIAYLGHIEGTKKTEMEWHTRFAGLKASGEWFRPSAELISAIGDAHRQTSAANGGLPEPLPVPLSHTLTREGDETPLATADADGAIPDWWAAAKHAMDGWSVAARGTPLVASRGETQAVLASLRGLATGPPIAGKERSDLFVRAITELWQDGTPWKGRGTAYVVRCIQGKLADWQQSGVPDTRAASGGGLGTVQVPMSAIEEAAMAKVHQRRAKQQ